VGGVKWKIEDVTRNWLKVRSEQARIYYILWEQDPVFLLRDVIFVIPFDPKEGSQLAVPLAAGEVPGLHRDELATYAFRDAGLVRLWMEERRKLETSGDLDPLPPSDS
jgi:hypothetical protein